MHYKLNMKKVGNFCRELRYKKGYRLDDVVERSGWSRSNISKFENGHNDSATLLLLYLHYFADYEVMIEIYRHGGKFYDIIAQTED